MTEDWKKTGILRESAIRELVQVHTDLVLRTVGSIGTYWEIENFLDSVPSDKDASILNFYRGYLWALRDVEKAYK